MNCFEFKSVGQGLFYTGALNNYTYNFVFDCGTSNKKSYMKKEIDNYIRTISQNNNVRPNIEFVVISHLHKDHFSGLYYLLLNANIKRIILPYLGTDKEFIRCVLAYSIFAEQGSDEREDMNNGYEFFSDERLYHLMSSLYGDVNDKGNDFRRLSYFLNDNNERINYKYDKEYAVRDEVINCFDNPFWQFRLINAYMDKDKLNKLSSAISALLHKNGIGDITTYLANKEPINKIKEVYETVFGNKNNLNLTSIVMLHFPLYHGACSYYRRTYHGKLVYDIFNLHINYPCCRLGDKRTIIRSSTTASLLTGDIMFDANISNSILNTNKEIFMMQIPHHGSKDNWNSVIKHNLHAVLYVLPFGYGNGSALPHVHTIDDLLCKDVEYYNVTQDSRFQYIIE